MGVALLMASNDGCGGRKGRGGGRREGKGAGVEVGM